MPRPPIPPSDGLPAAAPDRPPFRRLTGSLLGAAHPGPSLVVTAVAVALAVGAGRGPAGTVAVGAAVLTGQLAIGWTNDLVDADRDVVAGRTDKPVAAGEVPRALVRRAAWTAGVATVPLSFASGVAAGLAQLGVVASGLAYDLWLKATSWSWLPFAVAFGLLPAFVTLGDGAWPKAWVVATGSLLGVAAHLLNALPDLADDVRLGVNGLPQRLGESRTRLLAGAVLLAATAVLVVAPAGPVGPVGVALAVVGVVVVGAAVGRSWPAGPNGPSRAPFVLVAGLALLDVLVLVAHASDVA